MAHMNTPIKDVMNEIRYVDRRAQLLHSDWCPCTLSSKIDCQIFAIAFRVARQEYNYEMWGTLMRNPVLDKGKVSTWESVPDRWESVNGA